jgi:hypothetical protein
LLLRIRSQRCRASWNKPENGTRPTTTILEPLFERDPAAHIPALSYDDEHPLQKWRLT